VKKIIQKKPKKPKLPENLPVYDYSKFSDEDRDRAYDYYKKELEKVEKIITDKLIKAAKRVGLSVNNQQSVISNIPVGNPYMDIYSSQPTNQVYRSNPTQPVKQQSVPALPEVVASPLPYQPYTPGLQGPHMEMSGILSSGGVVKSSDVSNGYQTMAPNPFNTPVETAKLPIVEDNSSQLGAELGALLNENYGTVN
jgi:hypothetical protein